MQCAGLLRVPAHAAQCPEDGDSGHAPGSHGHRRPKPAWPAAAAAAAQEGLAGEVPQHCRAPDTAPAAQGALTPRSGLHAGAFFECRSTLRQTCLGAKWNSVPASSLATSMVFFCGSLLTSSAGATGKQCLLNNGALVVTAATACLPRGRQASHVTASSFLPLWR